MWLRNKGKAAARVLAVAAFWLTLWELLSLAVGQVLLLPGPLLVGQTLCRLALTAEFWQAVGKTLLRILSGFFIGTAAGVCLAFLTFHLRIAALLLRPLRHGIRAVPVASFIILALIWIPTNLLPTCMVVLMVLPLVWSGVESGLAEIDRSLLDMAAVYRLGWKKTLLRVRLPAVLPFFRTACVNAMGLAWKSGIAAEVICRPYGSVGRMLQEAKLYLETPEVFAWTAVVVVLSLILEKLLKAVVSGHGEGESHGN